ncbi:hypothetical protein ACNKHX_02155 [Shigella flexneri]
MNEVLMAHRKPVPVLNIGLPDFFTPQGTQEEMRAELGLDAAGMKPKSRPRWHNPYSTPAMLNKLFMAGVAASNTAPRKNRPSRFPTLPRLYDLWRAKSW